jgi:hypothetical protein
MENQRLEARSEESGARSEERGAGTQESGGRSQEAGVGDRRAQVEDRASQTGSPERDVAEDAGEEAEVATRIDENHAPEANSAPPPPDDDGYVWPDGAEASAETVGLTPTATAAEMPLPSLDELVKRIPADVRETLDDLFRVKFVSVKRISPSSLKS